MILKNNNIFIVFLFLIVTGLNSCVYSFSGSSLAPDVKTFSIATLPNNSGLGPANLSQVVTNNFRDYFQRNTNLKLVPRDGDLQFEGLITGYEVTPVAPQQQNGQDIAARNRLTIRLQVKFVNTKDPKQNFDQPFTGYSDFPQSLNLSQLDEASIRNILNQQIMTDIFNRSVANW